MGGGEHVIFCFSFIFSNKQRLRPLGYCVPTPHDNVEFGLLLQKDLAQGQKLDQFMNNSRVLIDLSLINSTCDQLPVNRFSRLQKESLSQDWKCRNSTDRWVPHDFLILIWEGKFSRASQVTLDYQNVHLVLLTPKVAHLFFKLTFRVSMVEGSLEDFLIFCTH